MVKLNFKVDKNIILSCNSSADEHTVLNWLSYILKWLLYTVCVIIWWLNAIKRIALLGTRHNIIANVSKSSSYEKLLFRALSLSVHWMNSRSIYKNIEVTGFDLLPKSGFACMFTFWQCYLSFVLVEKLFQTLLNSLILFPYAFSYSGFAFITHFSI